MNKKFIPIMLALAGSFSCQTIDTKIDTKTDTIYPKVSDKNISVFFEEHLPIFSGSRSECFFVDNNENRCIMINSVDEFRKIFSCSKDLLPTIDFKSYTLIIGQYQMPGTAYSVDEQSIIVESNKIELNINVQCPEGSLGVICPLYYWGIYPKIQNKPIIVNIEFQGGLCS